MPPRTDDARWLAAAARLAERGKPLSRPNPAVGAIVVKAGHVVGRGWTAPGGRPHAEAAALEMAGTEAHGATLYVTLEPCAHRSERGPACAELVAASRLARVVVGVGDPDPRTSGLGIDCIRAAGIEVELADCSDCARSLAGYLAWSRFDRPHVTLKLALSHDLRLAGPPEGDRWLTGEIARAHVHAIRAKMDAIVVGRGTLDADNPRLDVRLPGIGVRSPERWLLTRRRAPAGWRTLSSPEAVSRMKGIQWLMVEGGARTARAFLAAGLVDRMMLYRAPISVGGDAPMLPELDERQLYEQDWACSDLRMLGSDRLGVYERPPCSPE